MAAEAAGGDENTDAEKLNVAELTINLNTSDLNDSCINRKPEEIYKFGFSLKDLYKLSLEFYKKEKDAMTFTYDDKIKLVALWKQVSCGKYDETKMPDVGYFDFVGNDRRKAWASLGEMTPDTAMKNFCELLENNVSSYKTFVQQRKEEIEAEIERKRKEEEERRRREEEEKKRKEEEERIRREEQERIRLALEAERLRQQKEQEERNADTKQQKLPEPKLVTPQVNGTATEKAIAPASLWTRPKLQEFISHVKRDASSVLVVGRGETVTIRVPTHEHGSCLFWEFATEAYDVGFGVYFEWASDKKRWTKKDQASEKPDVQATNEKVEKGDDNETRPIDQIIIHENENNIEVFDKPDEILPVLRRNSHEEVIVGSHMYPGQGIYLLKFDNSYSLLRSKTLYYRVYYTK